MKKTEICTELKNIAIMIKNDKPQKDVYILVADLHNKIKDSITTPFEEKTMKEIDWVCDECGRDKIHCILNNGKTGTTFCGVCNKKVTVHKRIRTWQLLNKEVQK